MKDDSARPNARAVRERFDFRAPEYDRQSLWVNDARIIDRVLTGIPEGTRLLEVAAGTGAVSLAATQRGCAATCLDLSPGMLREAAAKGLTVIEGDMHHLPFADRSFDVVLIRQGLQYSRLRVALREFKRVAASEVRAAQIVASDESEREVWSRLFEIMGQPERQIFVKGSIQREAANLGLSTSRVEHFLGIEKLVTPNLAKVDLRVHESEILSLLSRIDPSPKREGEDWLHRVEWEVLTFV